MKALSLWQPWASLIYDGRKTIETRHWEMTHRGPLGIHAAKTIDKNYAEVFGYDWRSLPLGAMLCIVNVTDCVRFPLPLAPPDEYGDFEEGRFGILFTMQKKFATPLVVKGHQGIWQFWYQEEAHAEPAK
jgi:activating signal cointegrator 1